jgi:CBS domain containing-hemolysin-like protein
MTWQGFLEVVPYVGVAAAIVASGYFSGVETGLYRLNRVRLHLAERQGRPGARLLTRMLGDMPGQICVILIGNNIANYAATFLMTLMLETRLPDTESLYAEFAATLMLTPALFIFGELVPKNLFNAQADRLMLRWSRPLWAVGTVFRSLGLVAALKGISSLWTALVRPKRAADPFPAKARLRAILRDSAVEGVVTPYQNELVEKIMELRGVRVAQAMVPAGRVVTVRRGTGNPEFRRLVASCPYSRLPATDNTGRNVLGIVRVHDVLEHVAPDADLDLDVFTSATLDLDPAMSVTQAIFAMQRTHTAMAIVRNVRGQFIGIITLKDLVEEIVGELEAW